ncbi:class I SAM-dependent methyltransferase, partial [bacterium]|nr:class I SAM-dependent methyltransferase [bacterium]
MSHHFNPDNKQHFYDHYFDRELPDNEVYQYDVGSYCTRRLICSHLHQRQGAVLEVGTGVSSLLADLQQFACFGIDISPRTIEGVRRLFAQKGLQADLRVASAELLPFDACSFDAIVSSHTFEHVENDHSAIKECARVLKPGGELILFVPGRVSGVATHEEFLRLGHYRMYNAKRMQEFEAITNYTL